MQHSAQTVSLKFRNLQQTDFLLTLKRSVEGYFKEKNIKKTGNWALYLKATILLTTLAVLYSLLVWFDASSLLAISLCVLLGLNLGAIGFNIMHDACHGSFSSKKWVNEVFGFSLNVMGGNADWWKIKHNIYHHTYTNIPNIDEDIAVPFMRMHKEQSWRWYHRYQQYYWPAMYMLTYLAWKYIGDFRKYFTRKIGNSPVRPFTLSQHVIFWMSKCLYAAIFILIPLMQVGLVRFIIGYLIVGLVCGFFIAIVFQLAHVVEATDQPAAEIASADEWAIHQVKTTANFGTKSRILRWLCGGLNFQIEHHLFDRISHVHYPALQPIVQDACRRYDIPYNEKKTLFHGIVSHIRMLKLLGKNPQSLQS